MQSVPIPTEPLYGSIRGYRIRIHRFHAVAGGADASRFGVWSAEPERDSRGAAAERLAAFGIRCVCQVFSKGRVSRLHVRPVSTCGIPGVAKNAEPTGWVRSRVRGQSQWPDLGLHERDRFAMGAFCSCTERANARDASTAGDRVLRDKFIHIRPVCWHRALSVQETFGSRVGKSVVFARCDRTPPRGGVATA